MNTIIFLTIIFIVSYITGKLFKIIKLPTLLGYMVVGLLVGNLFSFNDLLTSNLVNIITSFALSIILLKAGLGIERAIVKKVGIHSLLLGTIPNLLEGIILATLSVFLLKFSWVEALMFGYIISAVSPAVVIPTMLRLIDKKYDKTITTLNITATSFDDVVSLTIFSVLLSIFLGHSNGISLALLAPIKIILGALFGALVGYGVAKILKETPRKVCRLIQFAIIIGLAILIKVYGHNIYIVEMIAIMTFGFFIEDGNHELGHYVKHYTNITWNYAQIFLFFTIGFLADITVIGEYLWIGLLLIMIGLVFRMIGVQIALAKSPYSRNQKQFTMIGNIPKATVQAVLGAVPLSVGVINGDIILSISALAILFTAPLGLIFIEIFSPKLLQKEKE